ncbi:unnamed protein product [Phyllotreta striolata]|uniref:Chitin-binding type-2 domain-containing protein n=1 Tax=Phyllotreta striolata TaxID=444603 RepID=A0A9N9TME2_PHYSR|nr:unnamed protein product [Phyllotreta striolata]
MKTYLSMCCVLVAAVKCFPEPAVTGGPGYTQLTAQQVKHLQGKGFGETQRSFRPTEAYRQTEEDFYEDDDDSNADASQNRAATYVNQNYPVPIPVKATVQPNLNYPIPVRTTVGKGYSTPVPEKRPQKHYLRRGEELQAINKLEEEKEEEEPDRLSLLLPQTKFNCNGKNTGYYADEELGCEVFHYCQENARHSWICPEGFTFHQVHLICMPPGGDNICDKSHDYHFVNDFLYKPLNLEEFQQKPNVTLRYSDRYYPEQYRSRYDEDDDTPVHHQHSVRVTSQPRQQYLSPTTLRPQHVYRSPEDINIPLQQRRPNHQYVTDY